MSTVWECHLINKALMFALIRCFVRNLTQDCDKRDCFNFSGTILFIIMSFVFFFLIWHLVINTNNDYFIIPEKQ